MIVLLGGKRSYIYPIPMPFPLSWQAGHAVTSYRVARTRHARKHASNRWLFWRQAAGAWHRFASSQISQRTNHKSRVMRIRIIHKSYSLGHDIE